MSKKFLFLAALIMGNAACMETVTQIADEGFGVSFAKFDVSTDQKYEIKFNLDGKSFYQPVETKNGMLFFEEHALNSERKPIEGRYNPNQAIAMGLFEGFPQYPIVSGLKTDGHFSLKNLSTVLEEDILECVAINEMQKKEKDTNPLIDNLIKLRTGGHTTAAQRLPDGLRKLAQLNMLGNTNSWKVRAQFNQEKEELYLSLSILNRLRGDYNEEQFLEKIYDIDKKLNEAFNSGVNNGGTILKNPNKKQIENELQHKRLTPRHITAKALLLSVLCHVDRYPGLAKNGEAVESICMNFGGMARFVHHVKESRHAYIEGDVIPMYTDKSYWVLEKGFTVADLYKALYDVSYLNRLKINQVYIEGTMQNGIVIDLEDPTLLNRVKNMVHAYWDGVTRPANLIEVVIRNENGFFRLATAYPVYKKHNTIETKETLGDIFTTLNDLFIYKPMFGTMKFLPSNFFATTDSF
ncbi:MAG: hypothetical protein IJ599_05410 [Alphaproteobacteria bacterium]|nr:hypothetical protein [Alphaproteobacteria bacterium]